MNDAIKMQISAFVDGELPDAEVDLLVRRMSQDAALRKQAAEYLEMGRAMRGEAAVPGIEQLQERIAAALGDKATDSAEVAEDPAPNRALRPLVGVTLAASVALLAIVGLQFTGGVTESPATAPDTVAGTIEEASYTVPAPVDDELVRYYQSHGATTSELGANGMNARLVNLRLSTEVVEEEEPDAADDETAAEEPTTQP